jgi:hypothetical protein
MRRITYRHFLVAFILLLAASLSSAQTDSTRGVTDLKELETFLDGVLTTQMEAHHIAGAAVFVVKDGKGNDGKTSLAAG